MALRIANKIHIRLVNNVVAQGLRLQALALKTVSPAPKTRYPLNQQDANSYIENLKTKAFLHGVDPHEPDIVRSFNVNVHTRPKPSEATATNYGARGGGFMQRFMSSKAGKNDKWAKTSVCGADCDEGAKKKAKECKPGKTEKDKCPKEEVEGGPKFKLSNCKGAKEVSCMKRGYTFVDCKKPLSPYPAFSEACYEPLNPTINECKDCPWAPDVNHPTFKPPINKFNTPGRNKGKDQKRKLHTDARRFVTLRFGQPVESEKDRRQREIEQQPRPFRRQYYARKWQNMHVKRQRRIPVIPSRPPVKFDFKPLPEEQMTPPVSFRVEEVDYNAAQKRIDREEDRMEETLKQIENMILAKNRVRVTGPPVCGTETCDRGSMDKKKCGRKIKTKICPVDLLDRKPYKKFRDGKKKRSKKGKSRKGKHSAALEQDALEAASIEDTSREAMVMSYHNQTARASTVRPSAQ